MPTITPEIGRDNFKEFYLPYKQHRLPWFRDVNRYENFRYNQHFSEQEVNDLLKFRQAPIPIGLTSAICEMAEALLTASNPIPRVIPVPYAQDDPRHAAAKSVAYRYDAALKSTWKDSFGGLQFDKVIRDYDNVGHGLNYVVPRNEFGQFSVDYKHIPWHHFYPDYASKDILYRDSNAMVVSFVMSLKQGLKLARTVQPELSEEEFKKEWATSAFIDSPTNEYQTRYVTHSYDLNQSIRFILRIQLEQHTVHQIIPKSRNVNVPYKVVRELSSELRRLRDAGEITVVEQKADYCTEYCSLGSKGWKKVYPIKSLNIIPTVYDHRENPFPHGRVYYIYPLQRALNRFISLSVLNASLSNSLKFFVEQNSIVDFDKVQNYGSIPGVFIQWRRTHPESKGPLPVAPVPLSDAFLQFPRFIIYMMEYVSGIYSVMQGDAQNAPDVFSTVSALQSAGGMKIKRRLRNIEASLSQTGKVVAEMYREYAPPNGVITNVEKEKINTIEYNKVQMGDGGRIAGYVPETDLSIGFKDVEFSVESSKGFQAATEAQSLAMLASQLKLPELVPLVLDRLNIPDVDKVVENMNQRVQMVQKMQQQEQALQQLQADNKRLTGQVMSQVVDLVKSDAKGKAGRVIERFRKDFEAAGVNLEQFQQGFDNQLEGSMPTGGNGIE